MIWHNAKTNPPDAYRDVLVAEMGKDESAEGWIDMDGDWWHSTGHAVTGEIYAWSELPACPAIENVSAPSAPSALKGEPS